MTNLGGFDRTSLSGQLVAAPMVARQWQKNEILFVGQLNVIKACQKFLTTHSVEFKGHACVLLIAIAVQEVG